MDEHHTQAEDDTLTEQAAMWFLRLQDPACTESDRCAFDAWMAVSDEHPREYEQYAKLWKNLDRLKARRCTHRLKRRRPSTVPMLAILGLTLTGALYFWSLGSEQTFMTDIGERRHVMLSDGTAVDLNTDTAIKARLSFWSRHIVLTQGEALFTVAHEYRRGFEVEAAGAVVRDIGTRFSVRTEGDAATFDVLEGAVEVNAPGREKAGVSLTAGRRMVYSPAGLTQPVMFDMNASTAWLSGRWIFQDSTLAQVVRELNRYHSRKTLLADPDLGGLTVSGVFNTADRTGLLNALQKLFPLHIEEHGDETLLVKNNPP